MTGKTEDCFVRATLDNLILPSAMKELAFSDFLIKKSPNCIRDITIAGDDGSNVTVPSFPSEDESEPGFPSCDYYLEFKVVNKTAFDEAQQKLIWALDRLRLFKPGLLWGDLYAIFDSRDSPAGCSELKRFHEEGPYPTNLQTAGFDGFFIVEECELDSIVDFVNDLKDVPNNFLEVALKRFHLYFDRDITQDRAIDLMVALESMFSDDKEAIAYKIVLRSAYLIELELDKRGDLFRFIKNAYNERNSIVHGRTESSWFLQKSNIPAQTNLNSLEDVVRRSLLTLLRCAQAGKILKAPDLDSYLFFNTKSSTPS